MIAKCEAVVKCREVAKCRTVVPNCLRAGLASPVKQSGRLFYIAFNAGSPPVKLLISAFETGRGPVELEATQPRFQTTRWPLVVRASSFDQAERKEALSSLMPQNWHPLYCFVRRSGKAHQGAEDLIQGFFLHVVEKDVLAGVAPHRKSRFRSILLACLKNFIANDVARQRAVKRGGGQVCVSLGFTRCGSRISTRARAHGDSRAGV